MNAVASLAGWRGCRLHRGGWGRLVEDAGGADHTVAVVGPQALAVVVDAGVQIEELGFSQHLAVGKVQTSVAGLGLGVMQAAGHGTSVRGLGHIRRGWAMSAR